MKDHSYNTQRIIFSNKETPEPTLKQTLTIGATLGLVIRRPTNVTFQINFRFNRRKTGKFKNKLVWCESKNIKNVFEKPLLATFKIT